MKQFDPPESEPKDYVEAFHELARLAGPYYAKITDVDKYCKELRAGKDSLPPLAVGDEVVLIQRRSGIVREVSGETAIVDTDNKGGFYIILTAKEDETWERAK